MSSNLLRGADGSGRRAEKPGSTPATLVLTGFGKFAGVPENPTTQLVAELQQRRPELLTRVLETSMVGVRQGLDELDASLAARDVLPADAIWVHLGVYSSSKTFRLEHKAYNEADFRVPDERGESPSHAKIIPDGAPNLSCGFDLDALCSDVRSSVGIKARVNVTDDPGRFVCNYVYYSSLARHGPHVLFVHVPSLATAPPAVHLEVVESILDHIANSRLQHMYSLHGTDATARLVLGDDTPLQERRAWAEENKEDSERVLCTFQDVIEARTSSAER
ncbi:Pyroglutamyl-peptidase 1 [Hondaea fermentalgiana]|uniref:Pyroglutamyl-peptidase 1 n=1 Tax=Hondaea fermentalgiana TaxID=2315210 RepID=A0A2R5G3L0_9STRA|nr:Pyroglutamyl-peptidase 1 [Hondaea fermentalgiana]|eukprot:GBG24909.1 Pyroglutamyl-peptidase 1 [Hondaea fermentalgiana]